MNQKCVQKETGVTMSVLNSLRTLQLTLRKRNEFETQSVARAPKLYGVVVKGFVKRAYRDKTANCGVVLLSGGQKETLHWVSDTDYVQS